MKMKKPLPEANSGAGDRSGEGRLGERRGRDSGSYPGEAKWLGRSTAESKPRADEQEPNRRPTRRDELAQYNDCLGRDSGS